MTTRRKSKTPRRPKTSPTVEPSRPIGAARPSIVELIDAARAVAGLQAAAVIPKPPAPTAKRAEKNIPDLATVIAGATSDDAQLHALLRTLNDALPLPTAAFVVGAPVEVVAIAYDGLSRRGLTATCRHGEEEHTVSLADVSFSSPPAASAAALYGEWLGLPTAPAPSPSRATATRRHKAEPDDVQPNQPVDLIVVARKSTALRCRLPESGRELTLRIAVRDQTPGEIITVLPAKTWRHGRHPYLSGTIQATRLDVQALRLQPLELRPQGDWDPQDEYWGEEGEPIAAYARPIIAHGTRPVFELEQVIPGEDPDDVDSDPICEASDLNVSGREDEARELLMSLLAQDLRCLDAHAHLGNWAFEYWPKQALRHYAVGVGIGALSLPPDFAGLLPLGIRRQSPLPPLHAGPRPLFVEARPCPRGRGRLRPHALAQPQRQPRRAIQPRGRAARMELGRDGRSRRVTSPSD